MVIVSIIGAGFMGTTHANAYAKLNNASVKYVVDLDEERSRKLAQEISAQASTNIMDVLSDPTVELVDISLPTPFHPDTAIAALEAGKHVIVEKPIALTVEQAERMLSTAHKTDRLLMVAQVLRFMPEYAAIKKVILSGRLGKPRLGHAYRLSNLPQWSNWFRDPQMTGGAAIDLQIHDIDFLNWIFGLPVSVYSQGWRDASAGWNSLLTSIQYQSGAASIESSFSKPQDYPFTCGLRLECENGEIEYHFRAGGASFEQGQPFSYLLLHEDGHPNQRITVEPEDGFEREIKHFIHCAEKGSESEYVTSQDAFNALRTAIASVESLEREEKIYLDM